ncbi:MAG: hypothetical protein PVJ76_00035 [Gemmatimonadota bacterium]|jgi:hypothetical protein
MRRLLVCAILGLLAAGCDSGPEGPGDFTGTLQSGGVAVGGVVLEVVGSGVEDFTGAGGTRVFWASQSDPKVHRVIVIGEGSGDLEFQVAVEDRGRGKPRATVLNAVDLENRPLPVTQDFKVRFTN